VRLALSPWKSVPYKQLRLCSGSDYGKWEEKQPVSQILLFVIAYDVSHYEGAADLRKLTKDE